MPKGVPKAGFRRRFKRGAGGGNLAVVPKTYNRPAEVLATIPFDTNPAETNEQISQRIASRFNVLNVLAESCVYGASRALIVSGPAGVGKSHSIEKLLTQWDPTKNNHIIIKGYVRPTGLIKSLWSFRSSGQVIVFDDADTIFFDDVSLNLLKAVCDTTENRRVSWLSEGVLVDDDTGIRIPKSFDFAGAVIFLTNYDFDSMIERGHRLAPHLQALVSRSHYVDLTMKSRRDCLVRIYQVVEEGLLSHLDTKAKADVVQYITEKADRLRELSLRMAIKIGAIRAANHNWRSICDVTCCRENVK